jgi:hypothetical protein
MVFVHTVIGYGNKANPSSAEKIWKKGLILLGGKCPGESCDWCVGKKIIENY